MVSLLGVGITLCLLFGVVLYQNWGWKDQIKQEFLDFHRQQLKTFIAMAERYVEGEIQATEERLKQQLVSQMDQAWSLVKHVDQQSAHLGKEERIRAIAEALRPLRFHGESGYFFIMRFDGTEILFPPNPQKWEGVNMFAQAPHIRDVVLANDSIAKNHGSGFHRFPWTRPGHEGEHHLKISYIRAHAELGILVGSGIYVDEMTPRIQEEVLHQLGKMNFGPDAYFFATDWNGVVQLGPAQGKNMLQVRDIHGLPVVQRLIELAKNGGGFLEYYMPAEVTDAVIHKMSYVIGIPEWRWYIGVGRNISNLENAIASKEKEVRHQYLGVVGIALAVGLFLVIFVIFASRRIAGRIGSDLQWVVQYFRDAGRNLQSLSPERLQYRELGELAVEANAMVQEIRQESQAKEKALLALEKKNQEIEQILFITGHDLRTPLVTLQGFTSEMSQACKELLHPETNEERRQELLVGAIPEANYFIQSAATRMEALLGGVLRYGRISRIQAELQAVDIGVICKNCLASMGIQASSQAVHVQIKDIPPCFADPNLVMQIVGNLFENAVKYSLPSRPLELVVSGIQRDGMVEIRFQDNGIGISKANLEKVFGLFTRLHRKDAIQGEGLGLSISRRLATKMGGDMRVESEESEGSTFLLLLPSL